MAANEQRSRANTPPPPPPPPSDGKPKTPRHTPSHPRGPSPATQASHTASYSLLVSQWGIKKTPNVQRLINQAANGGFTSDYFITLLQKTPEFHQRFPGIYDHQGRLKMMPNQYISQEHSYQDLATRNGINVSKKEIGWMFKNNVSPTKAAQRFQADAVLQQNPEHFAAFNEELKSRGQKPLGYKGAIKFLLGQGNAQEYAVWQGASTRYAAEQAGLTFGGTDQETSLSQANKTYVAGKGLSEAEMKQHYKALAGTLSQFMPESQIQGFGLTQADLVQYEFGGPKQAKVDQMLQQLAANANAFNQGQVTSKVANLGQRAAQGERA